MWELVKKMQCSSVTVLLGFLPFLLRVVSLEEVRILDWDVTVEEARAEEFCGTAGLCANRTEQLSPNLMSDQDFHWSPCYCDDECITYGDCCVDVAKERWGHGDEDGSQLWQCEKLQDQNHIYMVSDCEPSVSKASHLARMCHKEVPRSRYHYFLDVPVLSKASNRTYANVYCAYCNQERVFFEWNATIECDRNVSDHNLAHFMRAATYVPGDRKWTRRIGVKNGTWEQTVQCELKIEQFRDLKRYLTDTGARRCKPRMIRQCPKDWGDIDVRYRCDMYSLHLYATSDVEALYKNPHCAICNGASLNGTRCGRLVGARGFGSFDLPPSFSVLFDYSGQGSVGIQKRCKSDEIWDDIRKSCHAIICGKYYEYEDGKCINITQRTPGCYHLWLNISEVEIFPNRSLLVLYTGKLYPPEEWEERHPDPNNKVGPPSGYTVCAENPEGDYYFKFSEAQSYFSAVCLAVSLTCLAIHITIYSMLKKLRNVPGKNLLSLAVSLFIAQLLFLFAVNSTRIHVICVAISLLIHYFYLAAFFWMNVMAFDVFRTFTSGTYHRGSRNKTFFYYSLYGWGIPLLIVTMAMIVNYTEFLKEYAPEYGTELCWINNKNGLSLFFILPIGSLLLENTVLFGLGVYGIYQQTQESKFAVKESRRNLKSKGQTKMTRKGFLITTPSKETIASQTNQQNKIRLVLYIKLAAIMGLGWTFGFISSLANVPELWYIFIILNGLQGAFIFLAFDLKRKVFCTLWEQVTGRPYSSTTSGGHGNHSHTSRSLVSNSSLLNSVTGRTGEKRYKVDSSHSADLKNTKRQTDRPATIGRTEKFRGGPHFKGKRPEMNKLPEVSLPGTYRPKPSSLILSAAEIPLRPIVKDNLSRTSTLEAGQKTTPEEDLLTILLAKSAEPRRSLGNLPRLEDAPDDDPSHVYASLKNLPSLNRSKSEGRPDPALLQRSNHSLPANSSDVLDKPSRLSVDDISSLNPAFRARLEKAYQIYVASKNDDTALAPYVRIVPSASTSSPAKPNTVRSSKKLKGDVTVAAPVDVATEAISRSGVAMDEDEGSPTIKRSPRKKSRSSTSSSGDVKAKISTTAPASPTKKKPPLSRSVTTDPVPVMSGSTDIIDEPLKRLLIKKQFQDYLTGKKEGRGPSASRAPPRATTRRASLSLEAPSQEKAGGAPEKKSVGKKVRTKSQDDD